MTVEQRYAQVLARRRLGTPTSEYLWRAAGWDFIIQKVLYRG